MTDTRTLINQMREARGSAQRVPPPRTGRTWEIWAEGYAATGERGYAALMAKVRAATFAEAVELWQLSPSCSDPHLIDLERLTYWGCKLFPSREDAARSFG